MLDFIGGVLDLVDFLFWTPRALWRLWKWLTEERALPHQLAAGQPGMQAVRWTARLLLGLWLLLFLAAAIEWWDAWGDTPTSFFAGLAAFAAGPALLVLVTGWWRDRIVSKGPSLRSG